MRNIVPGAFVASIVTLCLMTSWHVVGATRKTVHLKEESSLGHPIGNVAALLNLIPSSDAQYQVLSQYLLASSSSTGAQQDRKWIAVGENTGAITLRHRVDRERICGDAEKCIVRAQIFVTGEQKMLDLDVIIDDVNDNDPIFPVRSITVNKSESASLGDIISLDRFLASDDDQGNNSRITYSINRNGFFAVEQFRDDMGSQHLQLVVKNHLDFESSSLVRLQLTAKDGGFPKRATRVPIRVKIVDENDNKPTFEKQEYSVVLNENIPSGEVITRVRAYDADTGPWGTLRYSLSSRNKPLARHLVGVDAKTGQVILKQKLDREKHDGIRIGIEARDSSSTNQQMGGTWLVFHVKDVNDNHPKIMISLIPPGEGTTAYISEDATPDTAFAYVTVSDADLGRNADVTIEIDSVSSSSDTDAHLGEFWKERFQLDTAGLLGIATTLDREEEGLYVIVLKACDNGMPKLCSNASLELVVLDVNDNAPVFVESEVTFRLNEDAQVPKFVTTFQASDGDAKNLPSSTRNENGQVVTSTNGDVMYSILDGDGTFAIEPHTGRLTLVRPLDREQVEVFELIIEAKDAGHPKILSNTTKLTIYVDDVNDNQPLFTNPPEDNKSYYATILRDDIILRIQAIDNDVGASGEVKYSLASVSGDSGEFTSLFLLDSKTGNLRLNMTSPALKTFLGSYFITVEASDSDAEPLTSSRHFYVIVTDSDVLPTSAGGISHVIIIIVLATSLVLITVVVVVIFMRCRKTSKQSRTYVCHKVSQEDSEWSRASVSSLKQKPIEARRTVSEESPSMKETSKLWEDGNQTRNDSVRTASNTDVTNTSRHDAMMTRQFRTSTRSLGRGNSQCSNASGRLVVPDKYKSVPHLLTASSHDGDSGRGDSDPDVASLEVTYEQEYPRLRSNSHLSARSDVTNTPTNRLSRRCTDMCLKYGHSDACWMPPTPRAPVNPYSSPAFIDNKNSTYVQLCPLPQNNHMPYPDQQRQVDLEPIPESTPIRYFAYPASDLSSIYSNVIASNRAPPPYDYYHPARPNHDVTPRVTSFDHHTPTSRLSPISSVSSPAASALTFEEQQRKNHCVVRRDVAPDDAGSMSPSSAPSSPKRPTNNLARSHSADLLSTESSTAAAFGLPRIRVQSPAASEQNYRSNAYGNVSMRETEEIVQNIEKLLNT